MSRLLEKPWWAAVARPMIATALHKLSTWAANAIGVTNSAQTSNVTFRAALRLKPRRSRPVDSQPPATLPKSDIR